MYTSKSLIDEALAIEQHVCGTVRSDRGFPTELQSGKLTLQVGEWSALARGRTCAYAWMDSAHCQMLSSFHTPVAGSVRRRVPGSAVRETRDAPKAFEDYNQAMGGNDCGDMLRCRMSVHLRAAKWWKAVFFFCLDQAIIATFRMWDFAVKKFPHLPRYSMRSLLPELVEWLSERSNASVGQRRLQSRLAHDSPRKRSRYSRKAPAPASRYIGTDHCPQYLEIPKRCVRCHADNVKRETKTSVLSCLWLRFVRQVLRAIPYPIK